MNVYYATCLEISMKRLKNKRKVYCYWVHLKKKKSCNVEIVKKKELHSQHWHYKRNLHSMYCLNLNKKKEFLNLGFKKKSTLEIFSLKKNKSGPNMTKMESIKQKSKKRFKAHDINGKLTLSATKSTIQRLLVWCKYPGYTNQKILFYF